MSEPRYTDEQLQGGFSHRSRNGTCFECAFLDLSASVEVTNAAEGTYLLQDVSEFAGSHAVNILPRLNGFQGYDCVHFEMRS